MTRVQADAGICGHQILIEVERTPDYQVRAVVTTDCPNISKIPADDLCFDPLVEMTKAGELLAKIGRYIPHQSCVFTAALLKASEVEAGLALKKDASIRFID